MQPKVYVVLVNWNGWEDSIECIESLLRSEYANFSVIVVDNASTNDSVERLREWAEARSAFSPPRGPLQPPSSPRVQPVRYVELRSEDVEAAVPTARSAGGEAGGRRASDDARLILVRSARNGGFGAGNNLAFRLVRSRGDGDLIWLLNNDTVVTPQTLGQMVRAAVETGAIVGGTLRYYHAPDRVQAYGGGTFSPLTGRVTTHTTAGATRLDLINGACLMLSREVLESVGGFDENIFLYFEEVDLCIRAAKAGHRFAASDAVVYHKHGGSRKDGDDSFAWDNQLRNKRYVLYKELGFGAWVLVYWASMALFALGLAPAGKRKASRRVLADRLRGRLSPRPPRRRAEVRA